MAAAGDARVPGYLGRVLDGAAAPAGTCFQVEPGLLVTAWHVLVEVGAGGVGAVVDVDGLPAAGAPAVPAVVLRVDPVHDLAVLRREVPLPRSVVGLSASDEVRLGTSTVVTGHVLLDDPGHAAEPPRFLDAPGAWAGGTMRADSIPLGRLTSSDVLRGMSGAPVRLVEGDAVVGVVSERYNSVDGWLTGTVWVARAEDVAALLAGLSAVTVPATPLTEAADLVLSVDATTVRLRGAGVDVSAPHAGVRPGLANAINDVRRMRANAGTVRTLPDTDTAVAAVEVGPAAVPVSLRRAGQLLAESFLPGPVADALGRVLRRADATSMPVLVGVEAPDWAELPWEALPDPVTAAPLALHRLVTVYRKAAAPTPRPVPGPLRIVVAISAPTSGGGGVLDYERELRTVLAAVRGARVGDARVRIVPFATTAAIRQALDGGQTHVLHLSGHGGPGVLDLEDETGAARPVTATRFLAEAVPAGAMPPVICLAACYTAVAEEGALSFAAELVAHGAAAVVATETSVTDRYATQVFARLYADLAQAARPDVIAALAQARRVVQDDLATSTDPRDRAVSGLDEWGVVTVLAGGPTVVFDPATTPPSTAQVQPATRSIAGLIARDPGEFVGRRAEQRDLPGLLTGGGRPGVVLTGIGGIGKTTLAAEVIRRILEREPGRRIASLTGETDPDSVLAAAATALRQPLLMAGADGDLAVRALSYATRADQPWADRLDILREHGLDAVPLLLVLDNFEDNLTEADTDGVRQLRDPHLAGLLAAWVRAPGRSRLLITCRYPFILPGGAESRLLGRPLGPLTAAEALKLVWSLPSLDRLDDTQVEQVWRMVGGHPRTLEYVDALLARGEGRFADITDRLASKVRDTLMGKTAAWLQQHRTLDAALADAVTVAADDIVLDDLLTEIRAVPDAERLLLGVSVYREPVDVNAVLFQVGDIDPDTEHVPGRRAAQSRILATLGAHGLDAAALTAALEAGDLSSLPADLADTITADLAEMRAAPIPPRSTALDLNDLTARLARSSLLGLEEGVETGWLFVHRWTAGELARRWTAQGRADEVVSAHRRAAEYWQWRVRVWPQSPVADVHDRLEARHHLLAAADLDAANTVTEDVCLKLGDWGAWDRETALIQDTLRWLPSDHPRRPAWVHELGVLAQNRGDYPEAERRYQQALTISDRYGDQAGTARSYHQLGRLAQLRGDNAEAERRYRQALTIFERLGNQAGIAMCYFNLGIIAYLHRDYAEAERRYQQSLAIDERLGNEIGMATSYHHIGMLAQNRGDYPEAQRRYQQALAISERLGNQVGMAKGYGQLGILAYLLGDYAEAERRYQQSLAIDERLGNQEGMATTYGQLGILAQSRGDYPEAQRRYQQGLTINERLGNQAGIATCYHNLGVLAQLREDYPEAERRYQQALTIFRRLRDPASISSTYSQLGILRVQQNRHLEAVPLHVAALGIQMELGSPTAKVDVRALDDLRRTLGDVQFASAIRDHLDEESSQDLLALLNSWKDDAPPD
jgi:tetratricopeptide (TPR) repeat protein